MHPDDYRNQEHDSAGQLRDEIFQMIDGLSHGLRSFRKYDRAEADSLFFHFCKKVTEPENEEDGKVPKTNSEDGPF